MTGLRIHLFGHPRFYDGDTPVALPAPNKVLLLAAYLLLNRQQPVLRDHVAYLLWPDATESDARANLRRHLHLLRKQLPPCPADTPWLLTTHQTVHWNPAAHIWLDVAVLEEFDTVKTGGDRQGDAAAWRGLLDAYSGDFLADLYDDWVLTERYRLEQRYLHLLKQRLASQKERGDWPAAVETTRRVLALDPLSEEPYRELMELHYRCGDRAAALAEFDKCQAMLQAEMAAEPMPEMLALRETILSGAALSAVEGTRSFVDEIDLPVEAEEDSGPDTLDTLARLEPVLRDDPPRVGGRQRVAPLAVVAGLVGVLILLGIGLWAAGVLPSFVTLPLGAAGETRTLTVAGPDVTEDTWIDRDNPDLLYDFEDTQRIPKADYQQVHLMYFGVAYDRVLIRFDLAAALSAAQAPPETKIQQAVFRLHLDAFINEDLPESLPATLSVYRVLRPWQAETATYNFPWTQPGLAAGVDYDAAALASKEFLGEAWLDFDITELAQDWAAHPDENFGLMLMLTAAPQSAHYWVDTSDFPRTDLQPRLDITYIP